MGLRKRAKHALSCFCVSHMLNLRMRKTTHPPTTALSVLLRACTDDEREWLADNARTTVGYLYQLAGCHRGRNGPGAALALSIEDLSTQLNRLTKGRVPVVTVRELASMCSLGGG